MGRCPENDSIELIELFVPLKGKEQHLVDLLLPLQPRRLIVHAVASTWLRAFVALLTTEVFEFETVELHGVRSHVVPVVAKLVRCCPKLQRCCLQGTLEASDVSDLRSETSATIVI